MVTPRILSGLHAIIDDTCQGSSTAEGYFPNDQNSGLPMHDEVAPCRTHESVGRSNRRFEDIKGIVAFHQGALDVSVLGPCLGVNEIPIIHVAFRNISTMTHDLSFLHDMSHPI